MFSPRIFSLSSLVSFILLIKSIFSFLMRELEPVQSEPNTTLSTPNLRISLSAKSTARALAGLMNVLRIPKAHILGGSMGGMIAQEFVLNHPDKVAKLVLLSTSCGGSRSIQRSEEVSSLLNAGTGISSREEFDRLVLPTVLTPDFAEEHPDFVDSLFQRASKYPISLAAYTASLNAVKSFDTYERLQQIKAPTLILHGEKDVLVPPENGAILAEAIPNSKLVRLNKSAHILAEEMKEVIKAITEFLSN